MAFLDYFGGPLAGVASRYLNGGGTNNAMSNMQGNSPANMSDNQGSFFGGTPAQTQQFQKYGPQQSQGIDQLFQMGLAGLQNLKPFDFAPIEEQAKHNFNTQTAPSIAERFTAMGSGPRSSNYAPAFAAAGANLQRDLAAMKAQYGLQQQGQQQGFLQNLLGLGLTPQFENAYIPRQQGFAESAGGPLLQGLAQSLPYLLPLLLGGATGGVGTAATAGLPLLLQLLRSS